MNDYFNSPEFRAIMLAQESPLIRAARELGDSPLLRAAREMAESPLLKAVKEIEDSPLLRAAREIEDSPMLRMARILEESPLLRLAKELEESPIQRAIRELQESPLLRYAKEIEQSPSIRMMREIKDSSSYRIFEAIEDSSSLTAFRSISEQITQGYGALSFVDAFDLLIKESRIIKSGNLFESIDGISDDIIDRASKAPKGPLSSEFYLNVLLAFILFYLSQVSSKESEQRLLEKFSELEQAVVSQMEMDSQDDKRYKYFAVLTHLNLRAGPSIEHEVIVVLTPNLKVIFLGKEGEWFKIEYFDHIENVRREGWVDSRFVLLIDEWHSTR
ncbi:hypothetical protein CZ787_05275 [Halomonas citrativorans]|uniref:SH3b domain-containing protein n=1 Tax=Halomonas citrativorans TaxID=2742612 RepID=A0A1R4HUL5_9GAMM|nr:SH3 domain-containing protein [Halomonas citrativorans]SJN11146.1 hypothetical protein CZ787_05275 [Halomonas citrativorans]